MFFTRNTCNWSDFSALMILHHAINTAEMFTSLDIEQHKTNLLQCALSSELAQSYIILYELFTNIDPALA